MKTKIIGLISLCLCCISCQSNINNDKQDVASPLLESWCGNALLIIEFYEPNYKEHIMVYSPTKDDTCVISFNNPVYPPKTLPNKLFNTTHTSPFLELKGNYALVDWTDQLIFNMVVNTYLGIPKVSLLTNKWADYESPYTKWPIENIYVNNPVKSYSMVRVDALQSYVGAFDNPPVNEYLGRALHTEKEWEEFLKKKGDGFLQQLISDTNAAYAEYQEILMRMIEEGVLEDYFRWTIKGH